MQEKMKVAISFYYEWVLHDEFISGNILIDGSGGVYGKVAIVLNLSKTHYSTVNKVFNETIECIEKGIVYEPIHKVAKKDETSKIDPSSLDMHQIAKLKTNGSFHITTDLFNAYIHGPAGLPPIGYTVIYNSNVIVYNHQHDCC